ncbi:hypothetical protein [Blastomonas sp.]|uniref:hypothetical protein n=1 Tax=Blastomonas sp. TaxID=1909299 RepID=UPI00359387C0
MDFSQFRNSAIQRFLRGNADQLEQLILENNLNNIEREFLAKFVRDNIPKGPRGPKPRSGKPIKAALIRFWRAEVDGWTKLEAIQRDIECLLGVSATMARKYLRQIDFPRTEEQALSAVFAKIKIDYRRMALSCADAELIELYRGDDLKPISKK